MNSVWSYCSVRLCVTVSSSRQLLPPGEHLVEIILLVQRSMGIAVAERRLSEPGIMGLQEARQKRVAGFRRIDASKPPLLHQTVLQRPETSLDPALRPALRLGCAGADDLDGELVQRPAELGHAVATLGLLAVDPEDGVLVGVERHRLAIALQIGPRRGEIVEGRLRRDEARMHDPARGIVYKGEEGASRPPALEPPVVRAVDLD